MNDSKCDTCGAELVQKGGSGRPRKRCVGCKAGAERRKYAEDDAFRERDLKRRHDRYAANVQAERERSRRYYAEHGGADRLAAREALAR